MLTPHMSFAWMNDSVTAFGRTSMLHAEKASSTVKALAPTSHLLSPSLSSIYLPAQWQASELTMHAGQQVTFPVVGGFEKNQVGVVRTC